MNYQIEKNTDFYDEDALLPIWKEALPEIDQKRIDWAYKDCVYTHPSLYLMKDTGSNEFMGCVTVFAREIFINGNVFDGGNSGDFGFKKKFRSLGPALAIQKYLLKHEDDDKIIYSYPNKFAVAIQLRAGFKEIGKMQLYVKPLKLGNFIPNAFLRLFTPAFDLISRVRDKILGAYGTKGYKFYTTTTIDERFDRLWEETRRFFSVISKRDSKYLNWRYLANPYKKYRSFVMEDKKTKQLKIALVYRLEDNKILVDDILWDGSEQVFNAVFYNFASDCRQKGYGSIYFLILHNTILDRLLKKIGFAKKTTDKKLLINSKEALQGHEGNMLFTCGDDDY